MCTSWRDLGFVWCLVYTCVIRVGGGLRPPLLSPQASENQQKPGLITMIGTVQPRERWQMELVPTRIFRPFWEVFRSSRNQFLAGSRLGPSKFVRRASTLPLQVLYDNYSLFVLNWSMYLWICGRWCVYSAPNWNKTDRWTIDLALPWRPLKIHLAMIRCLVHDPI